MGKKVIRDIQVLYNDNDPFVSAWSRNLISQGLVPKGVMVERSIQGISEEEPRPTSHFFSGVLGWPLALQLAGFPEDIPIWSMSLPCQPFSVAGKGAAEKDERHLWPEMLRLIRECRPLFCIGEQVASKLGREWLARVQTDLEDLDFVFGATDICAAGVGSPNIRQRLFWVAYDGLAYPTGFVAPREPHAGDECRDGQNGESSSGKPRHVDERDKIGGMGESDSAGSQQRRKARKTARYRGSSLATSSFDGVADAKDSNGRRTDRAKDLGRRIEEIGGSGLIGGSDNTPRVGDANGPRRREQSGPISMGSEQLAAKRPSSGFWEAYDIIPCGDGKVRRVGSRISALAPGLPASMGSLGPELRKLAKLAGLSGKSLMEGRSNRVGRLRAYGNSINPILAAEFVRAFMEVMGIEPAYPELPTPKPPKRKTPKRRFPKRKLK